MKSIFGEVWIEFNELLSVGVNINTLNYGIKNNSPKWYSIKDSDDKRKRLIRFSSMDEKWKNAVKTNLCAGLEPHEWLELKKHQKKEDTRLEQKFTLTNRLENVCNTEYIRQGIHYPGVAEKHFKSLCRAAGIVEETANWYVRNAIPFSDHSPAKMVAEWIKANVDEYFPLKYVPVYHRLLLEKAKAFALEGVPMNELIFIPRVGNNNGAKYKKEKWWQRIVIYYRTQPKAYTQVQIFRKLRIIAERERLECPSESTVRQFLKSTEHLTVEHHTDLNNKRLQRHRGDMPLLSAPFSDDCWQMDGTQVQFIGHLTGNKTASGKNEVKTLYIVTVMDVYSGAYLGYWYGYNECEHSYRSALKMAVEITGRLPYELRYDQFPGSTTDNWKAMTGTKKEPGLLNYYGVKLTKTSKSTGKAHAERAFYTLQQVFESETDTYIGQGIKSSLSHARPTEKHIKRTQSDFLNNGWNFDQAFMSHMEVIATYNATPRSKYSRKYANETISPMEKYMVGLDGSGTNVSPLQIADLFWHTRYEGIRNGKIEFRERNKTYKYYIGVEEFELFEYERKGVKMTVRHDPFDLSEIMVFSPENEFVATLKETEGIQTFGRNADWEAVGKWKQEQDKIAKKKRQKLSEFDLDDQTAALLATSIPKAEYNDAQSSYALNHAQEWQVNHRKAASRPVKEIVIEDEEEMTREDFNQLLHSQL